MKVCAKFLALPSTLLALTLATRVIADELQWPYNLPRTVKYFPEDEAHIKRELEAQQKLAWHTPVGLRKLSEDPNEKFFLHYWEFGEQPAVAEEAFGSHADDVEELELYVNGTWTHAHLPALLQHTSRDDSESGLFGRAIARRQSSCPSDTFSCESNSDTTYCCSNGDTCYTSPSGSPGCCPPGDTCGNDVAGCDVDAGYSECGSGCCIPGAKCASTVCIFYGTATSTTTLPTATVTSGISTASASATTSPTTATAQPGSVFTTTATVIIVAGGSTVTTTMVQPTTIVVSASSQTTSSSTDSTSTASTCTTGYFSCPSSLGGGCCPNGQDCNTGTHCPDLPSSTATATAPILPTTVSTSTTSGVSISGASTTYSVCPTGYYMCSAVYLGGCCRVDRDCHTTYCPETDSTNVIVGTGVTIATGDTDVGGTATTTLTAPDQTTTAASTTADATTTTVAGSGCANNHYLCPASVGGGCCPAGYLCASNCVATISGVANQTKEAPSVAAVEGFAWSFLVFALGAAVAMVWL